MSPTPPRQLMLLSPADHYQVNDVSTIKKDIHEEELTNHYKVNDVAIKKQIPKDTNLEDRYKCMLCSNVMLKPVQTFRGNLACEDCYAEGQR